MGKVVRRGEDARQLAIQILTDGGTLDDAARATGFCRNYVRQLGAKNGIRFPRSKYGTRRNDDYILELYRAGLSSKEAAAKAGCSVSKVLTIWRKNGLRQLTMTQQAVKELRERGALPSEISEKLGIERKNVYHVAKAIGMPFTAEEVDRSIALGKEKARIAQNRTEEDLKEAAVEFFKKYRPEWEYIDGYLNRDGFMTIRCRTCGETTRKSAVSVRHGNTCIICPTCQKRQIEEKEKERAQQREALEKQKLLEKERRFWRQDFKQNEFKICAWCGSIHMERGRYCSEKCRRAHDNHRKDTRISRARKKDMTITLRKLYLRDRGACWICGGTCDYKDCKRDSSGNFIVGPTYPSIDHVYPLSRGGSHTWGNVKLAHFYCNTLKRDKVVS